MSDQHKYFAKLLQGTDEWQRRWGKKAGEKLLQNLNTRNVNSQATDGVVDDSRAVLPRIHGESLASKLQRLGGASLGMQDFCDARSARKSNDAVSVAINAGQKQIGRNATERQAITGQALHKKAKDKTTKVKKKKKRRKPESSSSSPSLSSSSKAVAKKRRATPTTRPLTNAEVREQQKRAREAAELAADELAREAASQAAEEAKRPVDLVSDAEESKDIDEGDGYLWAWPAVPPVHWPPWSKPPASLYNAPTDRDLVDYSDI